MNANELRIGNWLYSNLNEFNFQVEAEDIANISKTPEVVKPIPLTEEWLLKFGFEKRENPDTTYDEQLHGHGGNVVMWELDQFWLDENFVLVDYSGDVIRIRYVHQLQNLYFALTGEEL